MYFGGFVGSLVNSALFDLQVSNSCGQLQMSYSESVRKGYSWT